jgi:hypothetical protein
MRACFQCGQEIAADQVVLREDECPHCSSDLHCCRNCRFYDPGVSNQCRETQADWITEKDKANFCEFFVFADTTGPRHAARGETSARERFNKLFRD